MTLLRQIPWALATLGGVLACQGQIYYLGDETGGTAWTQAGGADAAALTGGSGAPIAPSGGAETRQATGGAPTASGGRPATGGVPTASGGRPATGGVPTASGGRPATGGQSGASDQCPSFGGGPMVSLPEGYCIDRTEVTRAEYATWLSSTPPASPDNQISACELNASFEPSDDWPYDGTRPDHPVAFVDWCDAYAYCRDVDKQLCGKIGGGSSDVEGYADAAVSQWYNACSAHGQNAYPYGDDYDADACNGQDHEVLTTVPVASMPKCQSSDLRYAGVYDLSGNVFEWEDACDGTDAWTNCRIRGGSFLAQPSLACRTDLIALRYFTDANVGFRCCSPEQR